MSARSVYAETRAPVGRILAAILCTGVGLVASSQTAPDRAPAIATIAVSLRSSAGGCVGTGLLVGHDAQRIYAVTTGLVAYEAGRQDLRLAVGARGRSEASLPATVVHLDATSDVNLAVLAVERAPFLAAVGAMPAFDVLGDAAAIVRRDSVSPLVCASGGVVSLRPRPVVQASGGAIAYQGGDLPESDAGPQPPAEGAPLLFWLGGHPTVVGLTTASRPRAEARRIDTVLERVKAWGVPVALAVPGGASGCRYNTTFSRPETTLGGRQTLLFNPMRDALVATVETSQECGWTAFVDDGGWLRVGGAAASAPRRVVGPGSVTLQVVKANTCGGAMRDGLVHVAGAVYRTSQDGSNAGVGC